MLLCTSPTGWGEAALSPGCTAQGAEVRPNSPVQGALFSPPGTPARPVLAYCNTCNGFSPDQQRTTSSSPLPPCPELTRTRGRQKAKLTDKVKKSRCLQLGINTAKNTGTYSPPAAPATPSAPDTAPVPFSCPRGPFSSTSSSFLSAFPRIRHTAPCCWGAGGTWSPCSPNLGLYHHSYSQPSPDHHTAQAFLALPQPSGGTGGFLAGPWAEGGLFLQHAQRQVDISSTTPAALPASFLAPFPFNNST